jgi:hypothetical protein
MLNGKSLHWLMQPSPQPVMQNKLHAALLNGPGNGISCADNRLNTYPKQLSLQKAQVPRGIANQLCI